MKTDAMTHPPSKRGAKTGKSKDMVDYTVRRLHETLDSLMQLELQIPNDEPDRIFYTNIKFSILILLLSEVLHEQFRDAELEHSQLCSKGSLSQRRSTTSRIIAKGTEKDFDPEKKGSRPRKGRNSCLIN